MHAPQQQMMQQQHMQLLSGHSRTDVSLLSPVPGPGDLHLLSCQLTIGIRRASLGCSAGQAGGLQSAAHRSTYHTSTRPLHLTVSHGQLTASPRRCSCPAGLPGCSTEGSHLSPHHAASTQLRPCLPGCQLTALPCMCSWAAGVPGCSTMDSGGRGAAKARAPASTSMARPTQVCLARFSPPGCAPLPHAVGCTATRQVTVEVNNVPKPMLDDTTRMPPERQHALLLHAQLAS